MWVGAARAGLAIIAKGRNRNRTKGISIYRQDQQTIYPMFDWINEWIVEYYSFLNNWINEQMRFWMRLLTRGVVAVLRVFQFVCHFHSLFTFSRAESWRKWSARDDVDDAMIDMKTQLLISSDSYFLSAFTIQSIRLLGVLSSSSNRRPRNSLKTLAWKGRLFWYFGIIKHIFAFFLYMGWCMMPYMG